MIKSTNDDQGDKVVKKTMFKSILQWVYGRVDQVAQADDGGSSSSPSPSELVEELLVELLVALLASHREEDVPTDELVDHFAIRGKALKNKKM